MTLSSPHSEEPDLASFRVEPELDADLPALGVAHDLAVLPSVGKLPLAAGTLIGVAIRVTHGFPQAKQNARCWSP